MGLETDLYNFILMSYYLLIGKEQWQEVAFWINKNILEHLIKDHNKLILPKISFYTFVITVLAITMITIIIITMIAIIIITTIIYTYQVLFKELYMCEFPGTPLFGYYNNRNLLCSDKTQANWL